MLPLIVILLVIGYVILDRSGMLDDIAASLEKPRRSRPPRQPDSEAPQPAEKGADSRLEVFEEFIERLDQDNGEDER
jgi:hypothetical protein